MNQSEIDKYISLISGQIHRYMNNQACGSGKVHLTIGLELMPTGEVIDAPKIIKSSGIPPCDDAAVRAILSVQHFQMPTQPDLLAQFRSFNLLFTPNN